MNLEWSQELNGYAEKHHNLVWSYLHKKRLDQNEYYDIVIFGYLQAIKQYYQSNPELKEKYKFTTIAYHAMEQCVSMDWRYKSAKKRFCITLSLQDTIALCETLHREDVIGCEAQYNDMLSTIVFEEMLQGLSLKQQETIKYKMHGFTNQEIAERCCVSAKAIEGRFSRLRKKYKSKGIS